MHVLHIYRVGTETAREAESLVNQYLDETYDTNQEELGVDYSTVVGVLDVRNNLLHKTVTEFRWDSDGLSFICTLERMAKEFRVSQEELVHYNGPNDIPALSEDAVSDLEGFGAMPGKCTYLVIVDSHI